MTISLISFNGRMIPSASSSPHKFYRMTPSLRLHSWVCPHHMKNNHSGRPPAARYLSMYLSSPFSSPDLLVVAVALTPTYPVPVGGLFSVCSNRYRSSFLSKCSRNISFYCSLKKIKKNPNNVNDSLHLNAGRYPTQCFGTKYCNHCLMINDRNNESFQPACEGKNNLGHAELLRSSTAVAVHPTCYFFDVARLVSKWRENSLW